MVAFFGMSDILGTISFFDSSGQSDFMFSKPYSEKTSELIDSEVKRILDEQYQRAKTILNENIDGLRKLAELLLEREVIFSEDVEQIFGKRPFAKESEAEKNIITELNEDNKEPISKNNEQ